MFEGDVQIKLPQGHIKAAGGYLDYDDNDPTANNRRHCYYYYVEGLHSFTKKFYAAARWSHIMAGQGFPLVGNGDFNDYFFNQLTKDLKRLSLGAGYRWSPSLLTKIEYTFDKGRELGGALRNHENLFAVEGR